MTRLALSLSTALGLVSLAPDVHAELGSERFELEDVSAWTLRDGELSVGPREVGYGFLDVFQVGTNVPLNVVGAVNGRLEWQIHDDSRLGIGVEVGALWFDPGFIGASEDFALTAFPLALRASGRPNEALRVHAAIEFLSARPDREAPDLVKRLARHLGPVGRLAARLGAELRFGEHVALLAQLEAPLVMHRETLRYAGEDEALDFLRGTLALHLVFDSFNLRVGGGYGPSVLGEAGLFPVVDLSFRVY